MKHLNLKVMTVALLSTVSFVAFSAAPDSFSGIGHSKIEKMLREVRPVREFRGQKPWSNPGFELNSKLFADKGKKSVALDPATKFEGLNNYNFLEGPDGSTWFYTAEYDYERIEHEYYTEERIKAYTFTIYDNSFKEVGKVHDVITLGENETRVASAVLDPAVSKKFFNVDDKPEVMVYLAMNTGANFGYKVNYYNKVYTIGGQKDGDNDISIATITGRCVDAINYATDSWSEDFIFTFVDDIDPDPDGEYPELVDFVNAYKSRITLYKKAGWNGGPEKIFSYDINLVSMPGDTTDGIYFISKVENGTPYFVFSHYEKPYFLDPTGFAQDENSTPDNSLIINTYKFTGGTPSNFQKVSTTTIPVEEYTVSGQVAYVFYSIGSVSWKNDIDMSVNGSPSSPAFVVARDYTTAANLEDVASSYDIYGNDGKYIRNLSKDSEGLMLLGNIKGNEPQVLFTTLVNNKYKFDFVDLYSGTKVLSLDQAINGEPISAVGDRVPTGNGDYKYAFIMSYDDTDNDGNEYPRVAWINKDGTLDRIDRINVGKNVARATINMTQDVLSPYLYDTDSAMEYAVLVGRYTGNGNGSEVKNEFVVIDDNGDQLAKFSEVDGKGAPYLYTVIFDKEINRLQMVYVDDTSYNIDIYELPFSLMAGGEGTKENPYQIASVGDLQMIKKDKSAHYVVVNDFDASGFELTPIDEFSGSIDGNGHHISNLTIAAENNAGLFSNTLAGTTVKNLTFINPVVNLDGATYGGLIAATARNTTLDNIKVYNLSVNNQSFAGSFGGLIGQSTFYSVVQNSLVCASDINLPKASNIGGIVGSGRTTLSVKASAFNGNITADTNIGGIVGETSANDTIADCHVDAVLTGSNTIGGIVGSSKRNIVKRCYVEGEIKADNPTLRGPGYSVGGVVGALDVDWEGLSDVIISENIVALKSIKVADIDLEEEFPGQTSSVHRIVGSCSSNEADYGDEWPPVYGNPFPEFGLDNNFALSSFAKIDDKVEAEKTSTEGATIDAIDRELLERTLGWSFGTNVKAPWHNNSDSDPWLFFESSIIITPSAYLVEEGKTFSLTLQFFSADELTLEEISKNFICEYDYTIIEMTGNIELKNNILYIEFDALKIGSTQISASILGQISTATVEVVEQSLGGVEDILNPESFTIAFDGSNVVAQDAFIEIYNTAGIKALSGYGSVSVESLSKGIYIAVAVDAKGNRATLKLAR